VVKREGKCNWARVSMPLDLVKIFRNATVKSSQECAYFTVPFPEDFHIRDNIINKPSLEKLNFL